jgi:iron complex transport system ATP-binding protein
MIKLENVSLDIYGSHRRILDDINWHISRGESWILFGRNGSGKTKLLEIITGYLYPSEGEVTRFGCGHIGSDIRELRKKIGYVSSILREKFNRDERLIDTVLSGLYASIGLYRKPSAEDINKAHRLLAETNLAGRENDIIGHLSDGEKQKVLMLRALINDPDILILDEPATGLDIGAREDFLDSLKNIMKGRDHSLIYVTHHVEEITTVFSRIFVIDDGKSFFNGEIEEAIEQNIFTTLFGRKIEVFRRGGRLYSSLD